MASMRPALWLPAGTGRDTELPERQAPMPTTTSDATDAIVQRATELATAGDADAVEKLIASVGADRHALEAARDQVAAHLHRQVDDFKATAALTLLNRTLSQIPIVDPLDWRTRWAKHRKP
jgi:hypothetical protein